MTFKTNQQLQNELKMLQGFILEWFSLILDSIKFQSESAGKLSELSLLRFVTNLWLRIIARLWDFWQMCDRDNCSSDVHGRLTLRSIASLSPDFNKTKDSVDDASDPVESRRWSITLSIVSHWNTKTKENETKTKTKDASDPVEEMINHFANRQSLEHKLV